VWVTYRDQSLDVLSRYVPWQRGQFPVGQPGNGPDEIGGTVRVRCQETQKHPNRVDHRLSTAVAGTTRSIKDELPDQRCVELSCIYAGNAKKLFGNGRIQGDG